MKNNIAMPTTKPVTVMFIITERALSVFSMVFPSVIGLHSQFQVDQIIIKFISINVVNYFSWFKVPTNSFFHNQPVFKDIAVTFSKRVVRFSNQIVTRGRNNLSTLPVRSIFHLSSMKIAKIAFSTQASFRSSSQICLSNINNLFSTFVANFNVHIVIIQPKGGMSIGH